MMDWKAAEAAWVRAGLPAEYSDILEPGTAMTADLRQMAEGCHFDYQAQVWVDGHDHAHCKTNGHGPLVFCGSDAATCYGWAEVVESSTDVNSEG